MKNIVFGLVALSIPLLSGCSLPAIGGLSSAPSVSFVRSSDGGVTFESKSTIDDKSGFATADVVSMASDPKDTRRIWIGTKEAGMFTSDNSGDTWKKVTYPPTRIYGLVIDIADSSHLFATGEWQGRGKIYQSADAGANWNEVYTEPANGTVITSLAQNPFNPLVLYAGTSTGVILRTNDGGATWKNIVFTPTMNGKIVRAITFDPSRNNTIYFLVDGKGVFVSDGNTITIEPASSGVTTSGAGVSGAISLALDPSRSGVIYVGASKGLFRSTDSGKTFEALNIIESSKKFPIAAVAVNPKNSNEISYVSALTLYKSTDGGVSWSTGQLVSDKSASLLRYDTYNPQILYIGFKK